MATARLPSTYYGQTEAEEYATDPAVEGQARIADLLESSIALATDVLLLPAGSVPPEIRASANRVRALARDLITFRESLGCT